MRGFRRDVKYVTGGEIFVRFHASVHIRSVEMIRCLLPCLPDSLSCDLNRQLFSRQLEVNNLDLSSVRAPLYRFTRAVAAKTLMMEVTLSIPRS